MTTINKIGSAALLALSLAVVGCSSKVAEPTQYSGFLSDYSQLKATDSPSGHETLRWVSPNYKSSQYSGIYYTPVVFYPAAKPNARISQETLDKARSYLDQELQKAAARHKPLVSWPGPGSLTLKTAITSVSAENQDLKFYEVVPVAAVVASTMAASGHRTQNSVLFLELELLDGRTGEPLIKVVRKAYGKSVPNNSTPITFDDLRVAIDEMVRDAAAFPVPQ